jgi:hypothetical protein
MAAQTGPRPINAFGGIAGNLVLSPVLTAIGAGLAANATLYAGMIVGYDASGNVVDGATAACVTVVGLARTTKINTTTATPPTSGLAGAINIDILVGPYSCLGDSTISTATPFGTDLFVVDNQTVSTSDAGGRLRAGYFVSLDPNLNPIVQFGQASPSGRAFGGGFATPQNRARAVVTTLQAYGGSGTGVLTQSVLGTGLSAADGVTLAAGDVVFIQEGTTNLTAAKDAGPWVVTTLGSVSVLWVLTRPDWWANGTALPQSSVVDVSGEGTAYPGTAWKTFVAKGKIIGTDAPVFWPRTITQTITLIAGTLPAITSIPLRAVTGAGSTILFYRTTLGGTLSLGGYAVVPVPTPGVTGSSSIVPMAVGDTGALSNADTSTLIMTVDNW